MQGLHKPSQEAVPEAGTQLSAGQGVQRPPGQPPLYLAPDHDRRACTYQHPLKRLHVTCYMDPMPPWVYDVGVKYEDDLQSITGMLVWTSTP